MEIEVFIMERLYIFDIACTLQHASFRGRP